MHCVSIHVDVHNLCTCWSCCMFSQGLDVKTLLMWPLQNVPCPILCRLCQRLFGLDLCFFLPLTIKNLGLSLAWTSCTCTLASPKWIDGSKIKRPRNYTTEHNLCVLVFQIHACCDHWHFVLWHSNFNFGGCLSVNTCTSPHLEAKHRASCIMWQVMKFAHFPLRIAICH